MIISQHLVVHTNVGGFIPQISNDISLFYFVN